MTGPPLDTLSTGNEPPPLALPLDGTAVTVPLTGLKLDQEDLLSLELAIKAGADANVLDGMQGDPPIERSRG